MKFRSKLFLVMMTIVILAYSVSGSLMITSTFKMTYNKELDIAREEHEILQDTFVMLLSHLPETLSEEIWRQVAKELDDTSTREFFYFWLSSEGGEEIYQSNSMRRKRYRYIQRKMENLTAGVFYIPMRNAIF